MNQVESGAETPTSEIPTSQEPLNTAPLTTTPRPTTTALPTTTAPPTTSVQHQNVQISAYGATQAPPDSIGQSYLSYAVTVKNPNPPTVTAPWVASRVALNITFKDAAGNVVASESPTIDYIFPGQTMAAADDLVDAKGVASMAVSASVGDWTQNNGPITGTFTAAGVQTASDRYGMKTTGMLKSTFQHDYKDLEADAVFYNASGAIIGGAHEFIDFVPANGSVSFEIGSSQTHSVAKTVVYVSPTFLTDLGDN